MIGLLKDPISDITYNAIWRATARRNTEIYRNIFDNAIPENCIKLEDWDRDRIVSVDKAAGLRELKGFLVEYPFKFLSEVAQAPANPPNWFKQNIFIIPCVVLQFLNSLLTQNLVPWNTTSPSLRYYPFCEIIQLHMGVHEIAFKASSLQYKEVYCDK